MFIGGYYFNPQNHVDLAILRSMATICATKLQRHVTINELPALYKSSDSCRLEIQYIIYG